jgi:hypothetical protein
MENAFGDCGHMNCIRSLTIALLCVVSTAAQAASPPGYVGFVVAGTPDPALPAFNAVSGASVNNVAIANPTNILAVGQIYVYSVWSHDVSVSGTCVTSYQLSQTVDGVKTILDSHVIKKYSCKPGTDWLWVTGGAAIPNKPGPAELTGIVKFGSSQIRFNVPVLIQ